MARDALFTPPLLWTSRHLDLVGCRFEDLATEGELQSCGHDHLNQKLWTIEAAKLESEVE